MTNFLIEIFSPKYGGIYSCVLIISILALIIITSFHIFVSSELEIKTQNERDLIEVMECNKLGELILKQEISYRNEDFALDHWVIRCK